MNPAPSLRDRPWLPWYRSTQCSLLHDFYIPALRAAKRYDRVAGYFRSTSLAIASQGFSALIRHGGHIRLVVGADLDPEDVRAVVDHDDRQRLATELINELGQPETWSAAVGNGLGLLSWMVERGFIEIRVALRCHRETGEPLPFGSVEDGYVHEKWAIFADKDGHRLLAEGSLNESRTALVLNAENLSLHCDWEGAKETQRLNEAERVFSAIWEDREPGLRVLELPEAVKQRLIQIARTIRRPREVDGSSEVPPEPVPPTAREWLQFAILRDGPMLPNGRFVGLATAPVEPWPHQAIVARRLIESWPYSFLLCDEVGLGKTIEAGLALRSLILSGLVHRVLIAPPASLARQWQNELQQKFFLRFARALTGAQPRHEYIHPVVKQLPAPSVFTPELVIVSTGLVRRKTRQRELAAHQWDIALIDEAHYVRRSNATSGTVAQAKYGDLYQAVSEILRPKCRALWLATATPMQLDPIEVFDLFRLTRRVGPFQEDPSLTQGYYEIQGRIQRGEPVFDQELTFLARVLRAIKRQDPELEEFIRQAVLAPANRMQYDNWLDRGISPTSSSLKRLLRAIFASAPLSRVMLRHNRSLLRVYQQRGALRDNLAHRHILPMRRIQYTSQEQEAYDALRSYSQALARQIAAASDQQARVSTGFYLSFLQRRFASSLHAIGETLRRRRDRVRATLERQLGGGASAVNPIADEEATQDEDLEHDDTDAEVIEQLLKNRSEADLRWELGALDDMLASRLYDASLVSSKMQALLGYVEPRKDLVRPGRIRQMVIFTQFWDTLEDIVRRFRRVDARLLIGTYSGRGGQYTDPQTGKLIGSDREAIKQRFLRGEVDILVCTDAAAEGLNLQTADYLVNFDLPWNPAKVEQRIGRIDRIGQRHTDIYVQNLCYLGSVEEVVYDRLLTRLGHMNSVVGEQQFSMLPVTEEDFRRLAEGAIEEEQLAKQAEQRIALTRQRIRETELTGEEVYEIYRRLAQTQAATPLPVTLDGIWRVLTNSPYLRAAGCARSLNLFGDAREPLLLAGIPGLVEGLALTTDRALYDEGVERLGSRLRFATYGEPAFEALMKLSATWDRPPCVRRVSVTPPGLTNQYLGYVVAVKNGKGSDLRLITGLDDLEAIALDEERGVKEAEVEIFAAQLQAQAVQEFKLSAHVPAIESDNELSGRAQAALALGVAVDLIRGRQKYGQAEDNFWKELERLRDFIAERTASAGVIRIPSIPGCFGQLATAAWLPFEVKQRPSGEAFSVEQAPGLLLNAALDAATRVAAGMKRKKAELSTDSGLARVLAEMEKRCAI